MAKKEKLSQTLQQLEEGLLLIKKHPLFSRLGGEARLVSKTMLGKEGAAQVSSFGILYLNQEILLSAQQWAYIIAHCKLHLAFGHFDAEKMPGYAIARADGSSVWKPSYHSFLWNTACDIFITKFLTDIKFGTPFPSVSFDLSPFGTMDERKIYTYLCEHQPSDTRQLYGTASESTCDMIGLDNPLWYSANRRNLFTEKFALALAYSASQAVSIAGGHSTLSSAPKTRGERASSWFLAHYPLLGALASGFRLIEDANICIQEEIQVAAVDVTLGEIYINPAAALNEEELKFVLAHEYLHAGLLHHERCQGRDPYLWNIACDYVINDWLHDMQVGQMPQLGCLYDETLHGLSAETIYDTIVTNLKYYSKETTFRGYKKRDVLSGQARISRSNSPSSSISLDDFYRSALSQGLEFHRSLGRGYLPAGLIEEIRALAMPPIPWDVKLANWFDAYFPAVEKKRSYTRPSRRQSATPDIPRPSYFYTDALQDGRTFGVIIDTSGSMSARLLGFALGAIASYAASRDVPYARVVFCDAAAYDAGYLSTEEIAGRVEIKGRGGTRLQPAIDLLESAKDFPKRGPILLITDGAIESNLSIHREHAFLIPRGYHLPFRARGEVFYFSE